MVDTRGAVVIAAALIGGAATVIAAVITQSGGDTVTSSPETSVMSDTPTQTTLPEPLTRAPTTSSVPTSPGDLAVSRPITQPACDGRFVVFVGAAVHPHAYQAEVQHLLTTYPGSEYLLTSDTCPSLRARDDAGNEIYGVYYGPFKTREQACHVQDSRGETSYVKILDTVIDSSVIIEC